MSGESSTSVPQRQPEVVKVRCKVNLFAEGVVLSTMDNWWREHLSVQKNEKMKCLDVAVCTIINYYRAFEREFESVYSKHFNTNMSVEEFVDVLSSIFKILIEAGGNEFIPVIFPNSFVWGLFHKFAIEYNCYHFAPDTLKELQKLFRSHIPRVKKKLFWEQFTVFCRTMNAGMTKSPKKESPRRSLRRPMDPESLDERTTSEGRASKIPKTGADAPSSEVTAVSKSSDLAEQEEAYRTKSETGKYAAYDVQNVFMSITDKGKYISLPGTSGSRLPFQRSLETSATSSPCSLQKETSRKEGGSLEGGSAGPDKEDNDSTSSDSTGRLVKDIPMERRKLLASSIQYIKDPSPDPESNESTMPSLESEILPPITYRHHLNVDVQKVPSREYLVPDAEHRKWMCDLVIKCYNLGDAIDIDLTAPALPAARYEDDGFSDDSSDGESEAYQMPSGAMGTVRSAENAYCFTCQMPLDNYVRGWRNNFLKRHPNLKMYSDFPKRD